MRTSAGVFYLHGDHLGSTSATSGASVSSQNYYAFGNTRSTQRRDASAGLMYYGARYYDATLGRFVSADTVVPSANNPQSLNRYSYVRNNPVNRIDPTGHEDCVAEDDWCWQNRWYEAHGYCWSDAKQD
ncbi:RHS repeat-associated core domain-containing protein [Anaerolineae bacterium CFX7]|nr:RHS repeat-associated core domain-containing protein [Anaerolineae bacterium CFX7]